MSGVGAVDVNRVSSEAVSAGLQFKAEVERDDGASEAARKAAIKKVEENKRQVSEQVDSKEVFARNLDGQQKAQRALKATNDPLLQSQFQQTLGNRAFQKLITGDQREKFFKAMEHSPGQASAGAAAFTRASAEPAFPKAVTTSQQAGALLDGLVQNPRTEGTAKQLINTPFMQNPKATPTAKQQALDWGMRQAATGNAAGVDKMLQVLNSQGMNHLPAAGQKGVLQTFQKHPTDSLRQDNVDKFVNNPNIQQLPSFARGKATELLGKTGADTATKESFEGLAGHAKFLSQSKGVQGRFFSTVGTGRPSEYRAISDRLLTSLHSPEFPQREGQVSKFLGAVSRQVRGAGGKADGIDTAQALRTAKKSPLPKPPTLTSMAGLEGEELQMARASNRAQVMKYYNEMGKYLAAGERSIGRAKYLEDLSEMPPLKAPPTLSGQVELDPETSAHLAELEQSAQKSFEDLKTRLKQRQRELRTKRRPPSAARTEARAERPTGATQRYFTPSASQSRAAATAFFGGAGASAPGTAAPSLGAGTDMGALVAKALADAGGQITPTVAQSIAQSIASTVAAQVMASLRDVLGPGAVPLTAGAPAAGTSAGPQPAAARARPKTVTGKTDGWGIQRTFVADLGGAPTASAAGGPAYEDPGPQKYGGATITTPSGAAPRAMSALAETDWNSLNKGELALMRNLGWDRESWNARANPGARWPAAMSTPFRELSPIQRESARQLGFTLESWDAAVSQVRAASPAAAAPAPATSATTRASAPGGAARIEQAVASAIGAERPAAATPASHPLGGALASEWRELPAEAQAALTGLGWSPVTWRLREEVGKWPRAMTQPFLNLSPEQQRRLRAIGIEEQDWDRKVQPFTRGQVV